MFCNPDYIAHRRETDGEIQWLSDHLTEVSRKSGEFASKIGLKEYGEVLGLLHDIGKASQEFQEYIKSAVGLINPDEDDYVDAYSRRIAKAREKHTLKKYLARFSVMQQS